MEAFFALLSQFIHLSPENKEAFKLAVKKLELPKGHVLVKENTVCNYLYFVESGLPRTYYFKDG